MLELERHRLTLSSRTQGLRTYGSTSVQYTGMRPANCLTKLPPTRYYRSVPIGRVRVCVEETGVCMQHSPSLKYRLLIRYSMSRVFPRPRCLSRRNCRFLESAALVRARSEIVATRIFDLCFSHAALRHESARPPPFCEEVGKWHEWVP